MSKIKNKRIALVGGAGFIGHHLALALNKLGAQVEIVDSLQVNNLTAFAADRSLPRRDLYIRLIHQRIELLRQAGVALNVVDARNKVQLACVLDNFKPQIVIHLAAISHAARANRQPSDAFDHILQTLENTLDYAKDKVEHFIYFSSSMVYGHFTEGVVDEETPCNPIGIYGALKFSGEKLTIAHNQVFSLPYTIIRPSALYGERCVSRRVGQIFIENAHQDLDLDVSGDGADRLDFTYINDMIQGVIKIIAHEKSRNEIFNLTYGSSRSIHDMANMVQSRFPYLKVNYKPKDALMPDRGTLSINKARRLIGYMPEYPLEKGFSAYMDWYDQIFETKRRDSKIAAAR